MKKLILSLVVLLGVGMAVWYTCASPLPDKYEVLATNTVVAKYMGVQEMPCRFMTALCPDRCDHATRLARFEVVENAAYEKSGQYGDEKLNPGDVAVVDVKKDIPGQSEAIAQAISQLSPGDVVRLTIVHYYVQQGQAQFPVRPAVALELISSTPRS